ncbi:MAG: hypothetical protein AAGU74_09465 [Bacillota bacterium]
MARIADGVYYGITDANLVSVKVGVAVENHAIKERAIGNGNGMGGAAKSIVHMMD